MTVLRAFLAALVVWLGACAVAGVAYAQPTAMDQPGSSSNVVPSEGAPPQAAQSPAQSTADDSYVLGPEDVVEVRVLGRADFATRARVATDGTIQLPYLGTIQAANRTTRVLGNEVSKALAAGGYFSNPIVQVEIVGFASRYVTVLGEVGVPGLIPIDRTYQLSEILARVGGVKEGAADYLVIRSDKGPERRYSIRALSTGDASQDPVVSPGDKIFIPKAELFYIAGQVKAPGAYSVESAMTLRMAIARAGGLTDTGSDHGVKITGKDGKVRQVTLSDEIQPGDVINVGERLF